MPAQVEQDVLINIQVDNGEAVRAIAEAQKSVDELKAKQKELDRTTSDGAEEYVRLAAQIRQYNDVIKANNKEIDNNAKQHSKNVDSLNTMRSALKNLIAEYDNLSKAEREGAKGKELLGKIQNQTREIQKCEEATGRYQRTVGNYPQFLGMASKSFGSLGGGIMKLNSQMLTLIANPIGAAIAAIVLVVKQLIDAFKKNDDALTALHTAFAAFEPVVNAVKGIFEALVGVIGKVAIAIANVANDVIGFFVPSFREAANATMELVKAEDALEDKEREYTVQSAENSKKVAQLRDKAADKEKYSAEQRKKFLSEAMKLEEQDLKNAQYVAKEKLRIAEQKAKNDHDTSDETKNQIAQLKAAAINAEKDYYTNHRKLQKEYNRYDEEDRREQLEKYKAYVAEKKQKDADLLAAKRRTEDLVNAAITDAQMRTEYAIRSSYDRQIEDLKTQAKEKKYIAEEVNTQIVLLEAAREMAIAQSQKEYNEKLNADALKAEQEKWQKVIDERTRHGERIEAIAENELAHELAQYSSFAGMETQMRLEFEKKRTEIMLEESRRREKVAEDEYERISSMTQEEIDGMYGSMEAWETALAQADTRIVQAQQQVQQNEDALIRADKNIEKAAMRTKNQLIDMGKQTSAAVAGIAGSFQDLFSTMAESDEKYSDYATAMALMQILVSTAISIANAIQGATSAAAATGPAAPITTPVFIAEMVGIVTSGIVSATTTLMKAKQSKEKRPKFATGGYIEGPGSGTSDSITARVSNGESVINARSTEKYFDLLSAINVAGGGRAFSGARIHGIPKFATGGYINAETIAASRESEAMKDAMMEAVAGVTPVVSVKEITRVANRVAVKERITRQ